MPAQEGYGLDAFIAALQDGGFFAQAGRSFALLRSGDWPGLQRWAASFGFAFTLPELLTFCRDNPNVLGQMGNSPGLSEWTLESLTQAAQT